MTDVKKVVMFLMMFLILFPSTIFAKEDKEINLYLFYGNGCPHCKSEEEFLNEYLEGKDNIKLYIYEVWYNKKNSKLMKEVSEELGVDIIGIPYLIIGENVMQGFMENSTEKEIKEYINYCLNNDYTDKAGMVIGVAKDSKDNNDNTSDNDDASSGDNKGNTFNDENKKWEVPILGEITAKDVSLPVLAIVIGLVDGFNPCAMWILLFLISMLIGTKDKKKMWILGFVFIGTSGLIYFLFMISWLNLAMFMNQITTIKFIISAFALAFGIINVIRYFKLRKEPVGCDVTNPKMRKKITTRIKNSVLNNKFIISILGIMILAALVNIVELLCSLGLPVVFTEILSINNLSKGAYIAYLLVYVLFFLIDDIIVFIIAMKTLKISVISNKYGKYSHLIGGVIMIIIAILMIFKPEWLMFNF